MANIELLMAVDIGTSGAKVGVIDTSGRLVCCSRSEYTTDRPKPGWSEQSPAVWWNATAASIKEVVRSIDASRLLGVCVTGLAPAMVYLDNQGEPVRAAPIWSDNRAGAELREVLERVGSESPANLLSQVLWLKRHEPDVYRQVRWVLQSFEFINLKLTGQIHGLTHRTDRPFVTRADTESCGLNFDVFPERVSRPGTFAGSVLPDVADELGLGRGLPVIGGTVDTFSAWLGTATVSRGIACNTIGTTSSVTLAWDEPLKDELGRTSCMPHITGEDWVLTGAMSSGGLVVDWFARQFYKGSAGPLTCLIREAASVPAGADGLIALPYLEGERSPIFDPVARGVFFGIGQAHTRAHFARAALESIAFASRHVCETMAEIGGEVSEVRVAGALASNDLPAQIISDMLGRPVVIPEVPDSSLLGAAVMAGFAIGRFESLEHAAQVMFKPRSRLEPVLENHARYSRMFDLYKAIYAQLKEVFAASASLNTDALTA